MNQILQVEERKENGKSAFTQNNILIVLIVIIIFLLFIGVAYYIYNSLFGNTELPIDVPTITLTKTENDRLRIKVEGYIGISHITYKWNNENEQIIAINGETNTEKIIDIPFGENSINVTVLDINGKETTKKETFVVDVPKPQIDLSVIGNDIKLSVTSQIELAEIIYSWNSENEKREDMTTYVNKLEFEKELEIPIGKNTLTIVAIDVNGGRTEKVQEIKGVTKATAKATVEGEYWHFTVTGKENIKVVQFEFNGKKYLMNTDTFGETKKVSYKVKLVEGTNYLKITSITESDGESTATWEYEYTIDN